MPLTGMKENIFDTAVRLFSTSGFECVNMREIAAETGIKAASIYNHFYSKQSILDKIYEYYKEHLYDNLKPYKEIKEIISSGSREDIINAFAFTFEDEDKKKYQRMILITKIIYMRHFKDSKAGDIFVNLMSKEPETLIKDLLDYGVNVGRFKPFDTKVFSAIFNGSRHIMGIKAFSNPTYQVSQLEEEDGLKKMLGDMLPFNE